MLLIRNFICKSPDYFTIWFSAGQWVRGAEKMNGRVKLAADKGIKKLPFRNCVPTKNEEINMHILCFTLLGGLLYVRRNIIP